MRRTAALRSVAFLAYTIAVHGADPPPIRILFVGNSLTTANDVPGLVEGLARANGERVSTSTIAYANYSLEDHWNRGDAQRAIAAGGWNFVVLQQGPSALDESRVLLIAYARQFANVARRAHARLAFYMVWPSAGRSFDFDGVHRSYQAAARETGGIFLPAGEAWRMAWNHDANFAFYGADQFHPTPLGSYLAALVIYKGLFGKAPARSIPGLATDAQWKLLQQAASEAVSRGR